jgi:hypothetical protein
LGALQKKSPDAESPKQHTSSLEQSICNGVEQMASKYPQKK